MFSLREWLGGRLCRRLGWAPGAAPEAGRAVLRALSMAALWTILIFAIVHWFALSGRNVDSVLLALHILAAAIGGFLALFLIGTALVHIMVMLPRSWLVEAGQIRKWAAAVGLAVLTTAITHVTMWAMDGISVRGLMPLSVMMPHLLGGLVGWGLIQELAELTGVE